MQHKQYGSGSDLANYMIDTYKLANVPVDEASLGLLKYCLLVEAEKNSLIYLCLDRVVEILSLFPSTEVSRKAFISNAFRYSLRILHMIIPFTKQNYRK